MQFWKKIFNVSINKYKIFYLFYYIYNFYRCEAADDLNLLTKEKSTIDNPEDAIIARGGRILDDENIDEEKFVVVYSKGYISEDEDDMQINNNSSTVINSRPRKAKKQSIYDKPPPLDPQQLTNLGVIKRDRRTIEELEYEKKLKRNLQQ